MALSFKYRREMFEGKPAYFPKIPVTLFNKGIIFPTSALLDSGATHIFIPREIANALELELKNPDMATSWTGEFKVWESHIGVIVGKGAQTFRQKLPCNVPDDECKHAEVVFGRSFFKNFEITFDEQAKKTLLKKSTLKINRFH